MLAPISFSKLSKWDVFFKDDFKDVYEHVKFGSKKILHVNGTIVSSPYVDEITSGMNETKYLHGFDNGHFGSFVDFNKFDSQLLITWAEVLHGRDRGLQI